jgi:3-hydroxybutyryl-CoA dehydrogenase
VSEVPAAIGVVGAGTMGAGIAQLAVGAGARAILHDPVPDALVAGEARAEKGLARWREKGVEAPGSLEIAAELGGLADCGLVIEAAPERLELKRELFARLSEACGDEAVLATNTSSIPVTSLAGAAARPENVVGMHFFNPPPLMKLLEVIAADQSSERALAVARATGAAMGKRVIDAADGPGFLVNRCGRPFGAESLRIVQERIATPEQVDRIVRLGGGFRMGPFELMDLVGIDVGFEVAKSFTELSFGEPRWKPSPLQARKVAAGHLGRKTGRGWYEYAEDGSHRADDPEPPDADLAAVPGLRLSGEGASIDALLTRADGALPSGDELELVACDHASLALQGRREAVGFALLPGGGPLIELTRAPSTPPEAVTAAERLAGALGLHHEWVADAPALVLRRIVAQLVNEAAFAIGEGVGSPDDVDAGLELGLNHPRGPVAWGRAIGFGDVLATIDGIYDERREDRYRAAPLLRAGALEGV